MRHVDLDRECGQAPTAPVPPASAGKRARRRAGAMRLRSPHHHIKKGLNHPNRLVAGATWLLLLVAVLVLIRLVMVLIDDFWVILIAWMQP